jgi:NAD(P)-dependent dehydrogenase (short-subunit alcohol dehydrogenase family)
MAPGAEGLSVGLLEAHAALAGKRAVVVGGAHGVGRTIVLALAQAGIAIATCDNDEESLETLVPEVEALGVRIIAVPADVCDAAALDRFYDRVEAEFDSVDILLNIAGGAKGGHFDQTDRAHNDQQVRLNYTYILDSVRRCLPLIRKGGPDGEKRGGSIVNFTTIEAHRGAANFAVYAGAKAAATNFSKALAVELGAEGIRVNLIAPDTTPSRNNYSSLPPEVIAEYMALPAEVQSLGMEIYIPQKVPPSQEDLANAVLILVSDLSRAITGITLHVDGGTSASLGFIDWPFGDGFGPAPMMGTLGRLAK